MGWISSYFSLRHVCVQMCFTDTLGTSNEWYFSQGWKLQNESHSELQLKIIGHSERIV